MEILNTSHYIRDYILESVQGKLLNLVRSEVYLSNHPRRTAIAPDIAAISERSDFALQTLRERLLGEMGAALSL